jgi:hypothetical protein
MVQFKEVSGALGTILGYLGAEVATESTFERLLWPQRFYHNFNLAIALQMVFLIPSGGPLHRAALETLGKFQENGLYRGRKLGNMLGTCFFPSIPIDYYVRTLRDVKDTPKDTRNGFWVLVSRGLVHGSPRKEDTEKNATTRPKPKRTSVPLHRIILKPWDQKMKTPVGVVDVSEDRLTWKSYAGIVVSELSSVTASILAHQWASNVWLAVYFSLPLLLKLISAATSIKRHTVEAPATGASEIGIIAEIDDLNHSLSLIEGPEYLVRQFFRHYGHPSRDARSLEVLSMAIVYLFVAYFPVGLVALLWMDDKAQTVWLTYQLYAVFAMHVARLTGLGGCGRTEERVVEIFEQGYAVMLRSRSGLPVLAKVETVWYDSVDEGRQAVSDITKRGLDRHEVETSKLATVQVHDLALPESSVAWVSSS